MYTITDENLERLRRELIDYYGTAMSGPFPMAVIDLRKVEYADADELIRLAMNAGINVYRYIDRK